MSLPQAFTIIGAGRIGQLFASVQNKIPETNITLLRRGETQIAETGPIILCTRNDDLQAIVDFIPQKRHGDLIFVQNGMLQTWLRENRLEDTTQALLYLAVSKIGDQPVDGTRSVVTGRHADFLCLLMKTLDLICHEVSKEKFTEEMVEKFLWNCCFGLLSQYSERSVGQLIDDYSSKRQIAYIEDLILELLTVCEHALGFTLEESEKKPFIDRLLNYSMSIYDYHGKVKEWKWRNGWLVEQSSHPQGIHHKLLLETVPELYQPK
ncbi:MAG: hypothetical protein VX278_09900 [Myxococcota bacterium]|nr:hypothetical protein [Myxococcota bacterium]